MQETNFLKLKTYEGTDIFDPLTVENANNRTVDDFARNITYTVTEQGTHQQEQDASVQALETRMGQAETNITNNQQAIGTMQAEADKNKEDIDGIKDDILRQDRQLDSLNESMMDVSETAQDAKTAAESAQTTANKVVRGSIQIPSDSEINIKVNSIFGFAYFYVDIEDDIPVSSLYSANPPVVTILDVVTVSFAILNICISSEDPKKLCIYLPMTSTTGKTIIAGKYGLINSISIEYIAIND